MNKKSLAIGLISGIILGSVGIGYAANQYVQALQNQGIKVSLNGEVQTFKDATTGETQYPLTYNNRTYLPLRNVAELSGLDVSYDATTNIASLNKPLTNSNNFDKNEIGKYIGRWDNGEESIELKKNDKGAYEANFSVYRLYTLDISNIKFETDGKAAFNKENLENLDEIGDVAGCIELYDNKIKVTITKGNENRYIEPNEYIFDSHVVDTYISKDEFEKELNKTVQNIDNYSKIFDMVSSSANYATICLKDNIEVEDVTKSYSGLYNIDLVNKKLIDITEFVGGEEKVKLIGEYVDSICKVEQTKIYAKENSTSDETIWQFNEYEFEDYTKIDDVNQQIIVRVSYTMEAIKCYGYLDITVPYSVFNKK